MKLIKTGYLSAEVIGSLCLKSEFAHHENGRQAPWLIGPSLHHFITPLLSLFVF